MTKANFFYLLYLMMPQTSKRSSESESWDIRLHKFDPNWVQIILSQKGKFLGKLTKNILVLLLRPIILHFKIFREWIMRYNAWDIRLHNFGPCLAKLHNCVKRGFLGKNDQYYIFQSIMSHYAKVLKK